MSESWKKRAENFGQVGVPPDNERVNRARPGERRPYGTGAASVHDRQHWLAHVPRDSIHDRLIAPGRMP
jgi:hypothetical protein